MTYSQKLVWRIFCRAGEVQQVLAFQAINYMTAERSYMPWYALTNNMGHVRRMLLKSSGSRLLQVRARHSSIFPILNGSMKWYQWIIMSNKHLHTDLLQIHPNSSIVVHLHSYNSKIGHKMFCVTSQEFMQRLLTGVVTDLTLSDRDTDSHLDK